MLELNPDHRERRHERRAPRRRTHPFESLVALTLGAQSFDYLASPSDCCADRGGGTRVLFAMAGLLGRILAEISPARRFAALRPAAR